MAFSKLLLSFLTIFSLLLNLFPLNLFSPETALANPSGWLSDYSYRKAINIDNTQNSNALTNYQVSVDTTQAIYNETGLVGSWHMNEMTNDGNLLNLSTWALGTGSVSGFSANGAASENYRILGADPFGKQTIIWEARTDEASDADGGWNTSQFNIDPTKTYRFSVWVNRTVQGNGYFYLGLYGYNSSDSNVGVIQRNDGTNNTNPYFWYTTTPTAVGEWTLVVGYVWPAGSGTGANNPNSGRYTIAGGKVGDITTDFVWRDDNTKALHRSYLYYSTDTTTRQQWAYPRVDLVDGSEPSIQELLSSPPTGAISDSSGENNNGTVFNFPTLTDGKFGSALSFDGTDDYVNTGNSTSLKITGDLTIEFWAKPTNISSGRQNPICKSYGAEFCLTQETNGSLSYYHGSAGGNANPYIGFSTPNMFTDNTWVHVVISRNVSSRTLTSYKNGVFASSTTWTSDKDPSVSSYDFKIGAGYVNTYNGSIDEVRIYNRALSAEEISAHYNAAKVRLDYGDIRFTDSDGTTLLNYWQESDKKAWIKVPTIPANSTKTIYMYYGNSSATSQSNGDNTFVFFDDFNSDTSANYVVVESGTKQYDSTNKVLKQTNTSQVQNWIICSADSLPNNYVYQADVKIVNDPPNRNHAGLATDFSTSAVTGYRLTHLDTIFPLSKWSTGAETSIGSFSDGGIYADNKWLTERVYRNRTTGLLKYEVTDGITTVSGSYTDTTHTTGHLGFHSWGCEVWYDNVLVRNYTSPEPTTILGSETLPNQPPVISSVFVNPSSAQVGVKINFQIDWTDEDGDETKTHICKTDAITEQTCDGGAWCETTDWSGTSPSSCEYQTQDSDIGTQNYYIFVCDDKNNCSVSHSGNFQVSANQPPTISSAAVSSTSTAVGVPIEFSVDWSDPGDMIKMHICRTNSLTNQTCDGGFYCESSDFTTDSPSTCLFTPQISDLGTNTFYAFVCDSAGNCSDSKSGSFEVYEVMESGYLVLATTTSSGFLISSILDTGVSSGSNFHTLIWQGELCNNCQVRIQLASSNSPSGPWLYYGPTSTDDYYQPFANSLTILPYTGASSHQNKRYIRYKIELVPYEDQSPRVDSISINYTK